MYINRKFKKIFNFFGLHFDELYSNLIHLPGYFIELYRFYKMDNKKQFKLRLFPFLQDKNENAGVIESQYMLQDYYVAKKLYENNPNKHVDIGSRLDGFVTHVAIFREIEVIDIRQYKSKYDNIKFTQMDFTDKEKVPSGYCDSISSLHAIEHFGLGRYNDKIDPEGYEKGLSSIYKILKKGGTFYFSVPLGQQKVYFNAHRVFSLKYLLEIIQPYYLIKSFAYIDDNYSIHVNINLFDTDINKDFNFDFGLAIFELIKK